MRVREAVALTLVVAALAGTAGCQRSIFRQYEYEEEIYLKLDGSATVMVNSSIAALIALRGMDLDPNPSARPDRDKIRAYYQAPGLTVTRVSPPWRRSGRRFVQIRLDVSDIRQLARSKPFDWSTYRFTKNGEQFTYQQVMSTAAGTPPQGVNWDGTEIVAVRIHVPSKIDDHNVPTHKVDRGNIVSWEQPLRDRLAGQPLDMRVIMQAQSILTLTLTVFGLALAAAVILMVSVVIWVKRKGASLEARQV